MTGRLKSILYGCAPLALALAAMLTATPAAAQIEDATRAQKARTPNQGAGPAPLAPPAALPGATPQKDLAVPGTGSPNDMSPNDALFDAINRGDVSDARDAMNRGADLNARNILGLTPIDLSVDLNRNDITFLLLSLRGSSSPSGKAKTVAAGAAPPAKPQPGAPHHPPSATLVSARTAPVAPPPKKPSISSDPGTPAPQAGFLGFAGAAQQ